MSRLLRLAAVLVLTLMTIVLLWLAELALDMRDVGGGLMSRLRRMAGLLWLVFLALALLWLLAPALLWAAPEETLTITSGAVVRPSVALCRGGTAAVPTQSKAMIVTLDAAVYYTLGGAVPSASMGAVAAPNTVIYVDHATDAGMIAVSATARAYVVCIP